MAKDEDNKASPQMAENLTAKTAASATQAGGGQTKPTTAGASPATAAAGQQDAIALLKADHRKVEQLFAQYESAADDAKDRIVRQVCAELIVHAIVEEEIFYPACRAAASEEEPLDEAQVEHDSAKLLIRELLAGEAGDPYRDAQLKVLSDQIKHHVAEEEEPKGGIFAKAQAAGVDTAELGRRIQERKQRLQGRQDTLSPSRPVSFQQLESEKQENYMPRSQGPDRDERGQFTSDDDDRGSRGRYASGRSNGGGRRSDDDNGGGRGRGGWFGDSEGHSQAARSGGGSRSSYDDGGDRDYRSRGNDRDRDERGRFTSDDDDRGYRSRGGYDDDNDRGYRSGDYDRDRDERGRFTSDDDDRGYRSRSRDDDDDRGYPTGRGNDRDRDERGRFTDDGGDRGGYTSRGRDDDGRGWYGNSRGHAEAARRGWETRGGGSRGGRDDDEDGRRSSSGGRGQGQGGWFGNSRGHAEASRRGWENRR